MIPLFIAAVVSFRTFNKKWHAIYRIFSVLLISVFILEITAFLWKAFLHTTAGWNYSVSNLWLYNSFLIPQYLLYIWMYYQAIKSNVIKKIIIVAAISFAVFAIFNMIYIQSIHTVNSYSIIMASIIMVFVAVAYFEQLRKADEIFKLSALPMVWISLGAFVFHAANLPYIISLNYLTRFDISLAISIFYIYLVLNTTMYTFYVIALLCRPPHHK